MQSIGVGSEGSSREGELDSTSPKGKGELRARYELSESTSIVNNCVSDLFTNTKKVAGVENQ